MPADNIIVGLRPGHIDTIAEVVPAATALSIELKRLDGALVPVLHIDVARGETVEEPFSVGIPLTPTDVMSIVTALTFAQSDASQESAGDYLN